MDQFEAQESIGTTIAVLNQCELLQSMKNSHKRARAAAPLIDSSVAWFQKSAIRTRRDNVAGFRTATLPDRSQRRAEHDVRLLHGAGLHQHDGALDAVAGEVA
jgi:hypothetical protein